MRILRPSRRSACFRHVSALSAPSHIGAASSKLMPAGICAIRALTGIARYSACAPNLSPVVPKTRSPTANSVTAAPAASTSPANSVPRTRCLGRRRAATRRLSNEMARPLRRLASRVAVSHRLTVVAWTLTRTSVSLGTGRSTSSSRRTSGGPYRSKTTALMWPGSHVDDDLSLGVAFAHVIEGLANPVELVAPVNDGGYFSFHEELLQDQQVGLVELRDEERDFPRPTQGRQAHAEKMLYRAVPTPYRVC